MSFTKKFNFAGDIPASKSLYNRYLILKSFEPRIKIFGSSNCEDVRTLEKCIDSLALNQQVFHCGEGGTTLRFLALRLSRLKGQFTITGNESLMKRPHSELLSIFKQFGVFAKIHEKSIEIESSGWQPVECLKVDGQISSQFYSAILLSAWDLNFALKISKHIEILSESYFTMTLSTVRQFGLKLEETGGFLIVHPSPLPTALGISVEADTSSAFSIAALAVLYGTSTIENWPHNSLQPDSAFCLILEKMGAKLKIENNILKIFQTETLLGITEDLHNMPDLFPVLAVLCAFAKTSSRLFGAPHLKVKESNRIAKIAELFNLCKIKYRLLDDGLEIFPSVSLHQLHNEGIIFSAENDHRLVMAGHLLKPIFPYLEIKNENAVKKSYPEFLEIFNQSFRVRGVAENAKTKNQLA